MGHTSSDDKAVLQCAAAEDTCQTPQLLMRTRPPTVKGAASHSVTFASSRPSPISTLETSYHGQRTSSSSSGYETRSSDTGCKSFAPAAV